MLCGDSQVRGKNEFRTNGNMGLKNVPSAEEEEEDQADALQKRGERAQKALQKQVEGGIRERAICPSFWGQSS